MHDSRVIEHAMKQDPRTFSAEESTERTSLIAASGTFSRT